MNGPLNVFCRFRFKADYISFSHSLFNDVNGPLNVYVRFRFKADYVQAVDGMKKHLLRYTEPSRLAFMGALSSVNSRSFRAEMVSAGRQVS